MSYENKTGLNVKTHYGPRSTKDGVVGGIETRGPVKELTFELTGYAINNNRELLVGLLPKGAFVKTAIIRVKEAFSLGGTSPVVNIGTVSSAGTNGVSFNKTQLEAVGTYEDEPGGSWEGGLTANTNVGIALGGTTPTIGNGGKARVTISYYQL